MHTILITGANKGLGLEMTRQYAKDGWHVIACCRNPQQAYELQKLNSIEILELDVSNLSSINNLVTQMAGKSIDILLNNAGIWGPKNQTFGMVQSESWLEVFKINTMAPLILVEALFNNILAGNLKIIANISSKMGSIGLNSSGGSYIYRSSKAALNAVIKSMALDLKTHNITVVALHPGWVLTDMGGSNAKLTPQESVSGLKKVLANITLADSGSFIEYDGTKLVW